MSIPRRGQPARTGTITGAETRVGRSVMWLLAAEMLVILFGWAFAGGHANTRLSLLSIPSVFVLGQPFKRLADGRGVALGLTLPLAVVGAAVAWFAIREAVKRREAKRTGTA